MTCDSAYRLQSHAWSRLNVVSVLIGNSIQLDVELCRYKWGFSGNVAVHINDIFFIEPGQYTSEWPFRGAPSSSYNYARQVTWVYLVICSWVGGNKQYW